MKFKQSFISFALTLSLSAAAQTVAVFNGNPAGERMPPSMYNFFPSDTQDNMSRERMSYERKVPATVVVKLSDADVIKDVQKELNAKGYFVGIPDGKLNQATRDALTKYQQSAGIAATGRLNAETLESLNMVAVPSNSDYSAEEIIYSE